MASKSKWNQTNGGGRAKVRHPRTRLVAWAVVGGMLAVGAFFAAKFAENGNDDGIVRAQAEKPKPIADAAPRPPAKEENGGTCVETNSPPAEERKELWLGREVKEYRAVTNGTLVVETFVTTDGKVHKYYHDERENALPSAADQMLAIMTTPDDGFGAPPLPHIDDFENAFGKAMQTEIVVEESDSAEVKAVKERVIAARKELLGLMAQGVNANDVVAEYRKAQEDNATIRFDAAKGVRELLDAGDLEAAKALCAKYNEVLERANIMPIEIPDEYLEKERKP